MLTVCDSESRPGRRQIVFEPIMSEAETEKKQMQERPDSHEQAVRALERVNDRYQADDRLSPSFTIHT